MLWGGVCREAGQGQGRLRDPQVGLRPGTGSLSDGCSCVPGQRVVFVPLSLVTGSQHCRPECVRIVLSWLPEAYHMVFS